MRAAGRAIPALDDAVLGSGDLELARIGKRYRELGLPDADALDLIRLVVRGLAPIPEAMRQIAMKLALLGHSRKHIVPRSPCRIAAGTSFPW